MNKEANTNPMASPSFADVINWFHGNGDSIYQPLTTLGLDFLHEMTNDALRSVGLHVWSIACDEPHHEAQTHLMELQSEVLGVVVRLVG